MKVDSQVLERTDEKEMGAGGGCTYLYCFHDVCQGFFAACPHLQLPFDGVRISPQPHRPGHPRPEHPHPALLITDKDIKFFVDERTTFPVLIPTIRVSRLLPRLHRGGYR